MIRIATEEDKDIVMEMAKQFASSIALKDQVDPDTLEALVWSFLTAPNEEKIIILHGEVGMLAAFVTPFPLGTVPTAVEVAWWVEPEARKQNIGQELVEAYEFWAKKMGCKFISMACYENNNLGKFYEKCGYKLTELAYTKELK